MMYAEYQENAARTLPDLGKTLGVNEDVGLKLNLSHMVLGIHSEYNELADAETKINTGEELADFMWYIAGYCTIRHMSLTGLAYDENLTYKKRSLNYYSSKLQNLVKRFVAYNKEPEPEEERFILYNILKYIEETFNNHGLHMSDWLEKNINKLKVRYPEKFTEEAALNRNLEEEQKELEK